MNKEELKPMKDPKPEEIEAARARAIKALREVADALEGAPITNIKRYAMIMCFTQPCTNPKEADAEKHNELQLSIIGQTMVTKNLWRELGDIIMEDELGLMKGLEDLVDALRNRGTPEPD